MEKYLNNPEKGIDNSSNSRMNFSTKKLSKKQTFESRNKTLRKHKNDSSSSDLIKIKKRKEKDRNNSISGNDSLLILEEIENEQKNKDPKKQKISEKRYIVDNIEDIFSKLSKEKLKLIIQETVLYLIVFIVCTYHWIFLFLSREKVEQNFCFNNGQFDACTKEQICKDYNTKMNLILFNDSLKLNVKNSFSSYNFFIDESQIINNYYKSFFIMYYEFLSKSKAMSKLQITSKSKDKINFAVILSKKEKWNLFYRYYNLCEEKNYFIVFVIMVSFGGIIGSLVFGFLSDIFGRRFVIRITLFIITLITFLFSLFSYGIDNYYQLEQKKFEEDNNNISLFENNLYYKNILKTLYVQEKVRNFFSKGFYLYAISIFFISAGLWPLLKSCMALLIENAKSELTVLIGFRRYNFFFGGLPAFFTSLIFVNVNNFTLTFFILAIINLIFFIYSLIFLEESIRFFYEYCEWPQLTEAVLKIYKVDINEFKTKNDLELKKFRKEENIKSFNSSVQNNNYLLHYNGEDTSYIFQNSYYNLFKEKTNALKRNIKRDTDFIIRLSNVRSNPFIIFYCLFSNPTFNNSKMLILIILILLYVTMNLLQKEFLEKPYFSSSDLIINSGNNILINSVFFYLCLVNLSSNFFFYGLYRINCFKTVIIISLIYNIFALFCYQMLSNRESYSDIYFNQYNPFMLKDLNRERMSPYLLYLLFSIYFLLNGVNFYVYLLILKISKTIYRCTYFSIHSIALIIAFIITECIHIIMDHYFLFLSVLNILCLLTFTFLSEFKELLYVVNDLKIDIYRPSKNIIIKQKID